MNLPERIKALEHDLAQAARDRRLEHRWHQELTEAQRQQAKHADHSKPVPRGGVDYAYGRPNAGQLRRAGVTFVGRYIDSGSGKDLTRGEAEDLSTAGLDLFLFRETTAGRMLAGYDAGALDAKSAQRAAHTAGMPAGRPIYYVCDREATGAAAGAVCEYLRGAVHATSWPEVGLYGGLAVVELAHALNRCRYLCQTLAWSGTPTVWSPHAQLRQLAVERTVAGVRVDIEQARAPDFGQWRVDFGQWRV